MNLYHLKYFFDAAETQQISAAAQKNHVTQSAVSQAIRGLERELDCQLTLHQRRSFELTQSGRLLFEKCRPVFEAVERLRFEMLQTQKPDSGEFVIGTTTSYAIARGSLMIMKFREKYPDLGVKLKVGNSDVLRGWLVRKQIDLALMVDDQKKDRRFKVDTLGYGNYALVRSINLKTPIHDCGIIVTRSRRPEVKLWLKRYRQRYGRPARIAQEIVSWEVIRSLIKASMGYGLVPDYVVAGDVRSKELKISKTNFAPVRYRLVALSRKTSRSDQGLEKILKLIGRGLK